MQTPTRPLIDRLRLTAELVEQPGVQEGHAVLCCADQREAEINKVAKLIINGTVTPLTGELGTARHGTAWTARHGHRCTCE